MTDLLEITASWNAFAENAPAGVLESITVAQLAARAHGYDVHLTLWDVDQGAVDRLAAALGCPTNEGWAPAQEKGGAARKRTRRQWSLDLTRDGLRWHVTATQDWTPAEIQAREKADVIAELSRERPPIDDGDGS
jgi:hypothetical protein